MELLFAALIVVVVFALLDAAAIEFGVDSRRDFDDPHAPYIGAH